MHGYLVSPPPARPRLPACPLQLLRPSDGVHLSGGRKPLHDTHLGMKRFMRLTNADLAKRLRTTVEVRLGIMHAVGGRRACAGRLGCAQDSCSSRT